MIWKTEEEEKNKWQIMWALWAATFQPVQWDWRIQTKLATQREQTVLAGMKYEDRKQLPYQNKSQTPNQLTPIIQ